MPANNISIQGILTNNEFQGGRDIERLFNNIQPESAATVKQKSLLDRLVTGSDEHEVRV